MPDSSLNSQSLYLASLTVMQTQLSIEDRTCSPAPVIDDVPLTSDFKSESVGR